MEGLIDSVRRTLTSSHQLSLSPNQIFITAKSLCGLVLAHDSDQILTEAISRLERLLDSDCQTSSSDRILEITTTAAIVLYQSTRASESTVFKNLEHKLEEVLLSVFVKNPIIPEEVEASNLSLARIYPNAGSSAIEAALTSMVSVGGDKLPVEASVELLGYVSDHLALNANDSSLWPFQDRIIAAASQSVHLMHREATTVPLIVRKVLLPLFQARSNPEHQSVAFQLIQEFSNEETHLPEAVVLAAALFDTIFKSGEDDLRCLDWFWDMIVRSLRVNTNFNEDPSISKKATLHLHVIHILKRVVEFATIEQREFYLPAERGDKKRVRRLETPKVFKESCFSWHGSLTETQWDNFFLVFDTLNEFGVHSIAPVIPKLLGLYNDWKSFPTIWVEILLHKFVTHGNTGVRQLGLGFLWSLELVPERSFSESFLFGAVLKAAADPKLCTEADRVVLPGNFLDCKASSGREMNELPTVLPVINRIEEFYLTALGAPTASEDYVRRSFACIAESLDKSSPRFAFSVTLRLLLTLAQRLPERHTKILDGSLVSRFVTIVSLIHDHHPHWLEARLLALLLDATMTLLKRGGLVDGLPQLLSLFGTGTVGPVGAAVSTSSLMRRLEFWIGEIPELKSFVTTGQWVKIKEFFSEPEDAVVSVSTVKGLTLLIPLSGSSDLAASMKETLKSHLMNMNSRTLMSHKAKLKYWLLFAEWGSVDTLYWEPSLLSQVWDNLRQEIKASFTHLQRIIISSTLESMPIYELSTDDWQFQSTESWDIVCAACTRCLQQAGLLYGKDHQAQVFGCAKLKLREEIASTVEIIILPLASLMLTGTREYGRIILYRNACQWVQAIATAHASDHMDISAAFSGKEEANTAEKLVRSLMTVRPQHFTGADVPCPLSSESWAVLLGQAYSAVCNVAYVLCLSSVGLQSPGSSLALDVFAWAEDQLDKCSASNLAPVADLFLWGVPYLMDQAKINAGVETLYCQAKNGSTTKEDSLRIQAAILITAAKYPVLHDATLDIVAQILTGNMEESEIVTYVATVFAAQVELSLTPKGRSRRDAPSTRAFELLKNIAIFAPTWDEEAENEAALAATEPLLSCWDTSFKRDHAPTIRMAAVARCLATSVLLQQVHKHPEEFGGPFVKELINMNFNDKEIAAEPCMPNSKTHRCRIHLWQLILAASAALKKEEVWVDLLGPLFRCLTINNMGSIRRYMELTAIRAMKIAPSRYPLLVTELTNIDQRTQSTGSFALVGIHLLLHPLPKDIDKEVHVALFPHILKLCSSQQHLLRLVAQIGVHELVARQKKQPLNSLTITDELEALFHYLDKHGEAVKLREKHHDIVVFDAEVASSPAQIFSVQRRESDFWLLESVPRSTFDRIRFVSSELNSALAVTTPFEAFRCREMILNSGFGELFDVFQTLPLVPHAEHANSVFNYLDYSVELAGSGQEAIAANELRKAEETKDDENIQQKLQSSWSGEVQNELHPRALGIKRRQSVIIVTTLLDNPVNVAGLCRCSEIWTVEKVVVADKRVFQHPHFVAVARSAELWTPYEVVPPTSLVSYLQDKRSEGYTICGVEQTSTSESLPEYNYPERSVIVLGSEGQGMPANFIPLMDVCLEIPQYGLIRSLNVHVTGAVALYEYTRQHSILKQK